MQDDSFSRFKSCRTVRHYALVLKTRELAHDNRARPSVFEDKMDIDSMHCQSIAAFDALRNWSGALSNAALIRNNTDSSPGPVLGDSAHLPLIGTNAIRLIEVQAGQPNEPISIRLFSTLLESSPPYDAVSYVWGDPNSTVTISCNDAPLSITQNLHWALYRVRSPNSKTVLWADAICINQLDPVERSDQVSFMGQIYRSARHVLVCMGDEVEPGDASNVLHLLAEAAARGVGRGSRNPDLLPHDFLRTDWRWMSLARLMQRPWFTRAWVLQEAGMARRPVVLYGEVQFGYQELMKVTGWLIGSPWAKKFGIRSLLVHRRWIDWPDSGRHGTADNTLFDLVNHACLLSCQDPRDHVYAFLAHPMAQLEDGSGPIIRPDYERDVLDLYKEVTTLFLRQVGLRALVVVEHNDETISEPFPSWVVRWNVHEINNEISQLPVPFFSAGGLDLSSVHPVVEGNILKMKGIIIDTVVSCFQFEFTASGLVFVNVEYRTQKLTVSELLTAAVPIRTGRSPYGSDFNSQTLALGLTLCAGRPGCDLNRVIGILTHVHERVRDLLSGLRPERDHQSEEEHLGFWNSVVVVGRGRKLAVTERGGLGLVPGVTKIGDQVCIVRGLDVPLILRGAAADRSGERRWRLLGESYVQGVMEGQAITALQAGEVSEEDLFLI